MSSSQSLRAEILARVAVGALTLREAAQLLDISYRQAKRLYQRYQRDGLEGLVHGHRGHRSNRAKSRELREEALEFLRRKQCYALGPKLAAMELASQTNLIVSQETLRRWMLEAGLWTASRKRQVETGRSAHFGELVIVKGRPCSWPQERRAVNWIVELLDDASGTIVLFLKRDLIWALVGALRTWIDSYGVPQALDLDWSRLGVRRSHAASARPLATSPAAHFGRICSDLNIPITVRPADDRHSSLDVHWERLQRDFHVRTIGNDKAANAYLSNEYVPGYNQRVARSASVGGDQHRMVPKGTDTDRVFRIEEECPISEDWTVHYHGRLFQVQRESRYPPTRDYVLVYERPDGAVEIHYRGRAVKWRQAPRPSAWRAVPPAGTFLSSQGRDTSNE